MCKRLGGVLSFFCWILFLFTTPAMIIESLLCMCLLKEIHFLALLFEMHFVDCPLLLVGVLYLTGQLPWPANAHTGNPLLSLLLSLVPRAEENIISVRLSSRVGNFFGANEPNASMRTFLLLISF